jgi:FkbM family methyltransferase
MTELMKSTWTNTIGGIELTFEDVAQSNTVPYVLGEFELDFYGLEQIQLSPNDTVIDIGANIGMFSIYVKKKFGCKIIAFEPVPMNFEQFKKNIILNGLSLDDFELHNVAITDVEGGEIKIGTPIYNTGGSSTFFITDEMVTCKTETIDKYITDECTYLKIDCEGGEYAIIPTILDKLANIKYIGIEYHKFTDEQDPKALHALLKSVFNGPIFDGLPQDNSN